MLALTSVAGSRRVKTKLICTAAGQEATAICWLKTWYLRHCLETVTTGGTWMTPV